MLMSRRKKSKRMLRVTKVLVVMLLLGVVIKWLAMAIAMLNTHRDQVIVTKSSFRSEPAETPTKVTSSPENTIILTNSETQAVSKTSYYEPSEQANLSHFLLHIPKTGGVFAKNIINDYARNRYALCDEHLKPVTKWQTWSHHNGKGVPCFIYMSEAHYAPHFANHTYTVVRDPKEHVVSQYFHCKESAIYKEKLKTHLLMPSLEEWLETWTRVLQQGLPLTQAKEREMRRKYNCYNPINLQSRFLGFRHDDIIRQQDLMTRFDVLGVNSDLHKSICVMLIQMEPGVIPRQCDCTHTSAGPPPSLEKYAHGVQHHGSTFALTTRQANLIANLTQQDEVLYRLARRVFQDQVRVIEEEYSIRLCDSAPTKQPPPKQFRTEPEETPSTVTPASRFPLVDAVFTWVNGSEPHFIELLGKYTKSREPGRFRDIGQLRYALRSIGRYAPWVNHIYIVVSDRKTQTPSWLNTSHPDISVVEHRDIWEDTSQLPSFSSPQIESNLHRIPGLAPEFLYFNDDFCLTRRLRLKHLWAAPGVPICYEAEAIPVNASEDLNYVKKSLIRMSNEFDIRYGYQEGRKEFAHIPFLVNVEIQEAFQAEWKPYFYRMMRSTKFRNEALDMNFQFGYSQYIQSKKLPDGRPAFQWRSESVTRRILFFDKIRSNANTNAETFRRFKMLNETPFLCLQDRLRGPTPDDVFEEIDAFYKDLFPRKAPWELWT